MLSHSISNENPPWWYILRDPINRDLDIDELIEYGIIRFEMLKGYKINDPEQNKTKNFSLYEFINNYYIGIDINSLDNKGIEKYFLGHWYLRIGAAVSNRIESWLVESEGDFFEEILYTHNSDEQLNIFRLVAESEKSVTKTHEIQNEFFIPDELIKNNYWAIHWSLVPDLVSNKKGALYNGYLIGPSNIFQKQIKKLFEKKLRRAIGTLKKNHNFLAFIETNKHLSQSVKDLEKNLVTAFKNSNQGYFFDSLELEGENLSSDLDLYPPCMKFLIMDVKEHGYIKHNYRFQLGLFLKKIGMDVNTQLHFWFDLAVDNVGLTFEQFDKRAGYLIRHIYGLEGSRTDYEVPKCKKIMTDYFCPFTHINPKDLERILPNLYSNDKLKNEKNIDQIIQFSVNHRATDACSATFNSMFNQNKRIFHPLQWTKSSLEAKQANQS